MRFFLPLLFLVFAAPAQAQDKSATPGFAKPIDCTLGTDCWILNYIDHTPGGDNKAVDATCAHRTYDGHKGTDFAILNEAVMKKGVDVLATRDGMVTRMRNTEEDRFPTDEQLAQTKEAKKECGNAVLINHKDGWQTLYCHLKKGSITVKNDQMVKAGDKIGQVGLSGYTQFPHVHVGFLHNGKIMDPFSGTSADDDCTKKSEGLWDASANITYEELAIYDTGFDTQTPTMARLDKAKMNLKTLPSKDAPALLYHTLIAGAQKGDIITIAIHEPSGKVFAERTVTQEKTRARQMFFIGRKTDQIPLIVGDYKGTTIIKRGDKTWQKETIIKITP